MAKPIFLVGLPTRGIDEGDIDYIHSKLNRELYDYHFLIYPYYGKNIKFECFYEKDFNEIKYEELKKIIRERMNYKKKRNKDNFK